MKIIIVLTRQVPLLLREICNLTISTLRVTSNFALLEPLALVPRGGWGEVVKPTYVYIRPGYLNKQIYHLTIVWLGISKIV
jgi:hypothetical protein